jgi:hypothetical protein
MGRSTCSAAGSVRLRGQAQVGLERLPALGELGLGLLVGDRGHDDDVLALLPVHGGRHPVAVGELERVDDPQDLVEVPPGGLRIGDHQADLLLGVDHEHGAHRVHLVVRRMHHAVEVRDLPVRIRDDRELGLVALRLLDVGHPALVGVHRVDREPDALDLALVELALQARHVPELGGAHRGVVARVREQDGPLVSDPVVEFDRALGGLGGEVGGGVSESQRHVMVLLVGAVQQLAYFGLTSGETRPSSDHVLRCSP